MLQAQHIIKTLTQTSHHHNCFHLSQLYTRGVPLILLSIAGILLLKAMVLSHPQKRRKHLKYSCGIFSLALLVLFHQWFWILPGLTLYKFLPMLIKITHPYHAHLKPPAPSTEIFQQEGDHSLHRAPQEEKNTSLHYQYLSSYYSYDEQPQALYPQVLPPG